jgi:hypothetical protein
MDAIPQDVKNIFKYFVISIDNKLPIYVNLEILEWLNYKGTLKEKHVRFLNDLPDNCKREHDYYYLSTEKYQSRFIPFVKNYVESDTMQKINNENILNPLERIEVLEYFTKYNSGHHLLCNIETFEKIIAKKKMDDKFALVFVLYKSYLDYKRKFDKWV